ncbi:MAG: hypothetical protein MUP25_01810 [Syntrophales bacterium]|nr:hypothetical protein [Syntrophales bacterium]
MAKEGTTRSWSANQKRFIAWLVTPKGERSPAARDELAQVLKLRPETLARWEQLPGFGQAVYAEAERRLEERIPDILEVIGERAEAGDYRFIKLALEVWKRRRVQEAEADAEPEIWQAGPEDYARAEAAVAAWERERFGRKAAQQGGEGPGE